jgi:uncharacterized protein (DUF58 family)
VHLTARGTGLLAASVLLFGAGYQFGYPELAVLGCAGLVAVAGGLVFVAWKPRLAVRRVADPDRLTRGEACWLTLDVSNVGRAFGASLIARDRVRWSGAAPVVGASGRGQPAPTAAAAPGAGSARSAGTGIAVPVSAVPVALVRLRPGRTARVTYALPTLRRGLVEVGPLEISRQDPLALASAVRRFGEPTTVWVRPRIHPIAAVPVGLSRSMDGRVDRVAHGSITFSALREYVIGDDLRHVHWRTSAKVNELMVREHVDTSLPRVVVLLDDRASAHGTDLGGESTFEAACEAAASVVVATIAADIHVEVQLVSGAAASGGNQAEIGPLLDLLAEATLAPPADGQTDADLLDLAAQRLRVRRVGDTLLCLTGPPRQEDLSMLAGLRGAYPSIIVGVFGTVESGLSTSAGVLVVGAADGADFAAAWDGIRAW